MLTKKKKLTDGRRVTLLALSEETKSLQELSNCMSEIGINMTLPTVASYLGECLGEEGYKTLKQVWNKKRTDARTIQ
jgi:hypothetical protein